MSSDVVCCPLCKKEFRQKKDPKGGRDRDYCSNWCAKQAAVVRRRENRRRLARMAGIDQKKGRPAEYSPRPADIKPTLTYDAGWYAKNSMGFAYFKADYRGGNVQLKKDGRIKPVSTVTISDIQEFKIANVWNPTAKVLLIPRNENGEEDDEQAEQG